MAARSPAQDAGDERPARRGRGGWNAGSRPQTPGLIADRGNGSAPVRALREVAFWLERSRAETYRVRAYRRAADALAALTDDELALLDESDGWQQLPGLGPKTVAVVRAACRGETPEYLESLRAEGAEPLTLPERTGDREAGRALRSRCRGDLHTHTVWSDGGSPLWEMAETAARLGHEYLAVTDHSPRLTVANGLSAERLAQQQQEITAVQAAVGVRLLRGIEVDILDDGRLDQSEAALSSLDIVVASVHNNLRAPAEEMTTRMVAAVANPHTTVLGHVTGRLVEGGRGTRPQSAFDADVVFEACRQFSVAVEINSRPERRDPPMDLLRLASEIGCLFSIDTDAHAPGQLDFLDYGYERAAAAGIPPEQIITTWPVDEVLAFAAH